MPKQVLAVGFALIACIAPDALADWQTDIGYASLKARLGAATPDGAGIDVTQVEAAINSSGAPIYLPNPNYTTNGQPEFAGKTITPKCLAPTCDTVDYSSHGTTVGTYYYGLVTGIAGGILTIDVYQADDWLDSGFLRLLTRFAPDAESRRIENFSWVGSYGVDSTDIDVLRRVDLFIQRDGVVACAGANNGAGSPMPHLLSSAYNVITVGLSSGGASYGPTLIEAAGRVKPDIVAPIDLTSWGTPMVASCAALLLQTADANGYLGTERMPKALLTKAVLMAGASKYDPVNTAINSWRRGFATPSTDGTVPLDYRFGAGELNVDNAYRILTAGQQAASGTSLVNLTGWDYAAIAGGDTRQYFIQTPPFTYVSQLSIMLVWNRQVATSGGNPLQLTPSLANLDLRLFAASGLAKGAQVDQSVSMVDNVEHLFLRQLLGGQYVFKVTSDLSWDYALAWQVQTSPSVAPDLTGDGAVDDNDVALMASCQTGPGITALPSGCAPADLDGDGDVDQDDFALLQRCYSGAGVVADPTCYP